MSDNHKNNTFVLQKKKHLSENVENAIFQMIKMKLRLLYASEREKLLERVLVRQIAMYAVL